jgi:NAD+ synthase (glutamine-hydrolysing)
MSATYTIALAQIDNSLGDAKKNVEKHLAVVRKAREGGANLVVFPELSLTGYSVRDLNWDVKLRPHDNPLLRPLIEESTSIAILAGTVECADNGGIYNAAVLMENGAIAHVHRKVYPPTYGMFEESRYFSSGREVRAVETGMGTIGILVCEDLWHLSLPYVLVQQGAWLVIAIAASPTRLGPGEGDLGIARLNADHARAYGSLLSSYVVFCNRVGFEDGVNFFGGSVVAGPDGDILARGKQFEEDLVFAKLSREEVARARRFSRHVLDENPDIVLKELQRLRQR